MVDVVNTKLPMDSMGIFEIPKQQIAATTLKTGEREEKKNRHDECQTLNMYEWAIRDVKQLKSSLSVCFCPRNDPYK